MYVLVFFLIFSLTYIIFKIYFIYFWLCQVLVAACRIFIEACGVFCCSTRALLWCAGFSLVVACGVFFSSLVVVHGLSCPEAFGILVPWQGSNPRPLHWRQILYHWTTREVPTYIIFYMTIILHFSHSLSPTILWILQGQEPGTLFALSFGTSNYHLWHLLHLPKATSPILHIVVYHALEYDATIKRSLLSS